MQLDFRKAKPQVRTVMRTYDFVPLIPVFLKRLQAVFERAAKNHDFLRMKLDEELRSVRRRQSASGPIQCETLRTLDVEFYYIWPAEPTDKSINRIGVDFIVLRLASA